jgi:predicted transcriptional regulator
VGRKEATRSEVRNLLNRFFKDSHELLVLNLLEDSSLDATELQHLRELLGQSELAGQKGGES